MNKLSTRQRTLAGEVSFSGYGVHSAQPVTLSMAPGAPDSGYMIRRDLGNGAFTRPVQVHHSRVTRTTLCTTLDLGNSYSVATVEHVVSALSGMGVDNVLITLDGPECPIMDGSAHPFASAILAVGLEVQPAQKKFLKIVRAVTVRNNDAFAALEPYNGRALDLEIDFDSKVIGRQRMIFDWTPRRYFEDVSQARTFGFVRDAKILRQAGYALGSSLDNSITLHEDRVLNPGGLRYEDEFVRHKLLDAIGDLSLGGLAIWGKFRSYKGGHALNAHVLASLFSSEANYEIVEAEDLPLEFESFEDQPDGLEVHHYLRSVR
ncbi:UDP-3-O-[3-hydroxymyristoyl] N-acetylglucosamine deacetylase [Devosia lucknowensis]|uniref:UDP-3-O-acyl-N-acetylglucosamine deacetylase n=1 Tax=Devosia lucknowensis TaxID=1096929 RepID=A0A1Y6F8R8_9HYPH|nr:UDP-3-O-acyl-N-acetylglucosamine deacetylase [Devosia lucknowensis]SMQ69991.1 UDP-3-O-[3-hydroxymyristoyl] N-acetylglucosamine deacetylase [Devosia lucknowensis]